MVRTNARRYIVIEHNDDHRALVVTYQTGWTLPFVTMNKHPYTKAGSLTQAILDQFGIEVTVLRSLYRHPVCEPRDYADRVFAVETHGPLWPPPAHSRWIDRKELADLALVVPEHRAVLKAWFDEISNPVQPPDRAPWTAPGWLAQATSWIDEQLAKHGHTRIGSIKQLKIWSLSCLLQIETDVGPAFLKATPAMFPAEVQITEVLTEAYPTLMPGLLRVEHERRWLLMLPFAGRLLGEEPDIERWEAVLEAYASMQISMVGKEQVLMDAGCLDRRLNILFNQCEQMLADDAFFLGAGQMYREELVQLREMLPNLRNLSLSLEAAGIPYTLEHGDLHPNNAACSADSITLFDWSDACLSHPYFTLPLFLDEMNGSAIPETPEVKARLRDVYLSSWDTYGSMDQLRSAFTIATTLSHIHYAISYYCYIVPVDDEENFVTTPTRFLRKLLKPTNS